MKIAAFFDMDGTLLRGESQLSFLLWCMGRGIAPRWRSVPVMLAYLLYLAGISKDAVRLRSLGFGLFSGLNVEMLDAAAVEFFNTRLKNRIRSKSADLVNWHRQQGHNTALVTSASAAVAAPVAVYLEVDTLISTALQSENGVYTGRRAMPDPYGEGKALLVESHCADFGFSLAHSYAYSDHESDAPLLIKVGHPITAHPTRRLRNLAFVHGWSEIHLDGPDEPQPIR